MSDHQSFTQAVYDYLTQRPHQWVDSSALENIGGRMAWRTRVSDARLQLKAEGKGTIENRQRREWNFSRGEHYTISEYRYVPVESVTVRVEEDGQQVFI